MKMLNVLKRVLVAVGFLVSAECALGVTCTPGDWDESLCRLKDHEGIRCVTAEFFRMYCAPGTDGCGSVPGGCIGFTPNGHWYALVDNDGAPKKKCRCGCFSEATEFASSGGPMSGTSLLAQKSRISEVQLSTLDGLSGGFSDRSINSLTYGPDTEKSWVFLMESGKSLTVSKAHPMVIGDLTGKLVALKPAEHVVVGDLFLDSNMEPDAVLAVSQTKYEGRMMNFNVASDNVANHIVVANGILTGDSGWQEQLNNTATRIVWRNDIIKFLASNEKKEKAN